jgi:KaiC/GvpD/RAD55 family RecA-like ATPase
MAKSSTQKFLEIDKIKEGVVILKNRALRGVIMTSSLNFELKSEDEQRALIYQFQNFLNSLDFSIQVVIQSRKLNITGYLDKLKELRIKETNQLLKMQIEEYHKFIEELIGEGGIMSKSFFVVVPYTYIDLPSLTASEEDKKKTAKELTEEKFQRAKSQLWQRMEFVALGLRRLGLQCVPLNSLELIELFWSAYHPEESEVGYYPEIPPELAE